MKKTILILLLQFGLISYAQLDRIQIDTVLRDAMESIYWDTRMPLSEENAMTEWAYPIAILKDKQIYKVLYYHTITKTIITDDVKSYSIDCIPHITLSSGNYMLIQVTVLEENPMCDGLVCSVINNSYFYFSSVSQQNFSDRLSVSKSKITVQRNPDKAFNWSFDGFERTYYYLIAESGKVFYYLMDWWYFGKEEGFDFINEYFIEFDC